MSRYRSVSAGTALHDNVPVDSSVRQEPLVQPGYDALARRYAELFPSPYLTHLERHVVHAFADLVIDAGHRGVVVDVGSGLGQVTADLVERGLDVVGVEPSDAMREIAVRNYPGCRFLRDDAYLAGPGATVEVAAILARFSVIHIPPEEVPEVFATWARRLGTGTVVLIACQTADDGVREFDHAVARAWRWSPDRLAETLDEAGFEEIWRTVSRPDADHRFPDVHLVARRR